MPLVARLYFAADRNLANSMYGEPICDRRVIGVSYSKTNRRSIRVHPLNPRLLAFSSY